MEALGQALIVAPDFPPSSRPPALRALGFAEHLPEFGWEPVVLAADGRYLDGTDPSMDRLVPHDLEVVRTGALPARWTRKVGVGDLSIRAFPFLAREARRLLASRDFDAILVPVPPYYTLPLVRPLARLYGVPYVVDLIDPWYTTEYEDVPDEDRPPKFAVANRVARVLERFSLRDIDAVVGVSQGTNETVVDRYPWIGEDMTAEIPYGGNAHHLDALREDPRPNPVLDPDTEEPRISYVGAYAATMRPTFEALFEAVARLRKEDPDLLEGVRFTFVGTNYAAEGRAEPVVEPLARAAGVDDLVDEHPERVPYLDALQVMLDSDALLLLGSTSPHYTASKVFPYILSRRPLLTAFHEESSVVDILAEAGAGTAITFGSDGPKPADLRGELRRLLRERMGDEPDTDWGAFERYTTRAMTERLADALEGARS